MSSTLEGFGSWRPDCGSFSDSLQVVLSIWCRTSQVIIHFKPAASGGAKIGASRDEAETWIHAEKSRLAEHG